MLLKGKSQKAAFHFIARYSRKPPLRIAIGIKQIQIRIDLNHIIA